MVDEELSHAVVVWTGKGQFPMPRRDDDRLRARFGARAETLIGAVAGLHDDFYSSTAFETASDVAAMGHQAADEFRARHPEISPEAVDALEWCYTFDYR